MKIRPTTLTVALLAWSVSPLFALENEAPRRDQLKRLRGAITAYGMLNPGKKPAKLSDLVDESLLDGPAALLRPGSSGAVPTRADLDARADYTLEPLPGAAELVVREKTPLVGETEVLAIFSDGAIKAVRAGASASETKFAAPTPTAKPPTIAPRLDEAPRIAPTPTRPAPSVTPVIDAVTPAPRSLPESDFDIAPQRNAKGSATGANASPVAPPAPVLGPGLGARPDLGQPRTNASDAEVASWLRQGQIADGQGDVDQARGFYEKVLSARPASPDALLSLGNLHNREGELKEGIAKFQAVQLGMPGSAMIAIKLAELYVGAEDLVRARREANRALKADPKSGAATSWLATVEMLEGDLSSASTHFQQAIRLDPRVVEQRFRNVDWMMGSGQARRAMIEAVSVISMQPNHRGAVYAAGEAYAELADRERAAQYFRRYLELDSSSEQANEAREKLRDLGGPMSKAP